MKEPYRICGECGAEVVPLSGAERQARYRVRAKQARQLEQGGADGAGGGEAVRPTELAGAGEHEAG